MESHLGAGDKQNNINNNKWT